MSRSGAGKEGETLAAEALNKAGLRVIERNFRGRSGEIDIIALDGEALVFVEVKSWTRYGLEDLEKSINKRKRDRIIETAKYFLSIHREYNDMKVRFDVVFLGDHGIEHLESAFVE